MEQHLTNGLAEAAVEKTLRQLEKCGEMRRKGFFTPDTCYMEMTNAFYEGFWQLLRRHRLELRLTGADYPRFASAYRAYREEGAAPSEAAPWLRYTGGTGCAASPEEQRAFFRLMEAYRLPPEFFEPIPETVPRPGKTLVHRYRESSTVSIPFSCRDDGGLLSAEAPVGKTFTLVSERGLKAEVTIREDRRHGDREGMDFDEMVFPVPGGVAVLMAEFLAEGRIEGYTAREREGSGEILIRLKNGGREIDTLAYWESAADEAACAAYPLWREYYRLSDDMERRAREILSALFAVYGYRPAE